MMNEDGKEDERIVKERRGEKRRRNGGTEDDRMGGKGRTEEEYNIRYIIVYV